MPGRIYKAITCPMCLLRRFEVIICHCMGPEERCSLQKRVLPADCASQMLVPQVLRISRSFARDMGFLLGCCTTSAASCRLCPPSPSQYLSKDTLAWLRVSCTKWLANRSMDRQSPVCSIRTACRGSRRRRPLLRPCLWSPSTVVASGGLSARHLMAAQKACSEVALLVAGVLISPGSGVGRSLSAAQQPAVSKGKGHCQHSCLLTNLL